MPKHVVQNMSTWKQKTRMQISDCATRTLGNLQHQKKLRLCVVSQIWSNLTQTHWPPTVQLSAGIPVLHELISKSSVSAMRANFSRSFSSVSYAFNMTSKHDPETSGRNIPRMEESKMKDATITHACLWWRFCRLYMQG